MPAPISTSRLELVPFAPDAIRLLLGGKRKDAEDVAGLTFPIEFPTDDDMTGFLPIQLARMDALPERLDWMARLVILRNGSKGEAAGHCGFHGPPEVIGRAEIGYTVFSAYRGRGYAKEAAQALVRWAFEQGEKQVFATVAPTNAPSLAVVRALGFEQVGEQVDDLDGLELVFVARRTLDTPAGAQ